ncbi:hypothetical protein AMECASPLE_018819 [Ameca splendens]|uniref:Uncharacterized protein n=1 Tax=Ameca splendens TaxID=208324 RepID=A0ABV0Z1S4_9TELE
MIKIKDFFMLCKWENLKISSVSNTCSPTVVTWFVLMVFCFFRWKMNSLLAWCENLIAIKPPSRRLHSVRFWSHRLVRTLSDVFFFFSFIVCITWMSDGF